MAASELVAIEPNAWTQERPPRVGWPESPRPSAALPPSGAFEAASPSGLRPIAPPPREAMSLQTTRAIETGRESPSMPDWLDELAALLEAECDLRGIDP